jgi:hypothetical protein
MKLYALKYLSRDIIKNFDFLRNIFTKILGQTYASLLNYDILKEKRFFSILKNSAAWVSLWQAIFEGFRSFSM